MKILITGISGTVGQAFTKLLYPEHQIYGIDHNETNLAPMLESYPRAKLEVGDFADYQFEGKGIRTVIHLAAMKHIELCETNPNHCVMNNVIKTYALFKNAHRNGVRILFMSTDKAVEPVSVYGYTKALAEHMCLEYGGSFIRSGNVIASSGSVLNIWDEAIEHNEPLKITHKQMERYFISADHLAERAWSAYLRGEREIVPKMDKKIRLLDLAKQKLAVHNYTLSNYGGGVEFIGLRAGEKLKEKLRW